MKIDFSNCEINKYKTYGGANGNKIAIIYGNDQYMLKFPPPPKSNKTISYTNSCISEYISCNIIKILGFEVQETLIGGYEDKIVVACKDLEENGFSLFEFAKIKNSIIGSPGYNTELSEILYTISEQELVNSNSLLEFFWNMFVLDTYLGNFDRHNGNWGFLVNENTKTAKISPIFDCGSCLFPQNSEEQMYNIIKSKEEIELRVFTFPNSAIRENNAKINYYRFLKDNHQENKELQKSINKVGTRILEKENLIENLIDSMEYITDIHKNFIKIMLKNRFKKLIGPFIEKKTISWGL